MTVDLDMFKEIDQAEKGCRESFTANPNATLAWCCHHEVELEFLTYKPENRIYYILTYKRKSQQATRLNNFRPFISQIPSQWVEAYTECMKANAEWHEAYEQWRKVSGASHGEWEEGRTKWKTVEEKCKEAHAKWEQVLHASKPLLAELHSKDVPGHTWNGESIFPNKY